MIKRKVWIIEGGYDYENSYVLGVFTSKKRAERWLNSNEAYLPRYDWVDLGNYILNPATHSGRILGGWCERNTGTTR